jgi:hypothetical protein
MRKIEEFSDERNKSWCIHCSQWLSAVETNEDHVPSKSLLRRPHPHHLPVVTVCKKCNSGFSKDEQYLVTFLSSVLVGSAQPEAQANASAARSLAKSSKLRERVASSSLTYQTLGGEKRIVWKPEIDRVKRVILKNARGHAYFEFGEPMLDEPAHVGIQPLESLTPTERQEFETVGEPGGPAFWSEVGSRMMTRMLTGEDMSGSWVIVQEGVYRYAVSQSGGILVRSVLSEYLAAEVYWGN